MSSETPDPTGAVAGAPAHRGGSPALGGTVTTQRTHEEDVPTAGEDIHLPGGTAIPVVMTIGIVLTLVGTTIAWVWTIIGVVIFLISLILWIRDTRHEVAHLPDDIAAPAAHH